MLFQEFAITPQVFAPEYSESSPQVWKDLLYFLKDIRSIGLVGDINKEQWRKEVGETIRRLSPSLRDKVMTLLQELKKYNRIVPHTSITKERLNTEKDWVSLALEEDKLVPYSAIVATDSINFEHAKVQTLENLMEKRLLSNNVDSFLVYQNRDNLESYLTHFLIYARKLTIIDPYFTHKGDAKALRLFAKLFARRRGDRMKNRKIVIHVRYDEKMDMPFFKSFWGGIFREIYESYGHETTMNIWRDENRVKVLHDRHMITDQGGIDSGRGFGFVDAESTWKLLDSDVMRQSLNRFEPNVDSGLEFVMSVTRHECDTLKLIEGVVKKIIHDNERGKAGFIQVWNEPDHYFQISYNDDSELCEKIAVGTEVTLESYLQKNGKYRAVNLRMKRDCH